MWHALMGYWGGLVPNVPGTKKYNPKLRYPVQSPGILANKRDLAMDCMEKYGVGAFDANKAHQFLDDLHKYLASQGVDGVKVDVQNILETISTGSGGRVSLTKQFQEALEKSTSSNFQDNSIICCMGLSTDSIYQYIPSACLNHKNMNINISMLYIQFQSFPRCVVNIFPFLLLQFKNKCHNTSIG